jgi:hypothetical protein
MAWTTTSVELRVAAYPTSEGKRLAAAGASSRLGVVLVVAIVLELYVERQCMHVEWRARGADVGR